MNQEKTVRDKVFECCAQLESENKSITRNVVRLRTGGSNRDVSKYITEWKEQNNTAITVATNTDISQQTGESAAISSEAAPTNAPIQPAISQADIEQIKLEAQQRVKAKRLAVIKVAQYYEENPNLLPEEMRKEIEAEEMAAISCSLSHRSYYDPNALTQAVITSM
ncbi:DNA-binding protein [Iningainema tapete]|uniref:DNA-binding protein n=1 Tax=Iningainema tapete BLCC-T55 TaxID=2748662 RepID=A0A8J6XQ59_9CYAN|nr:DNA-binding protein [Iningainema tapete]MBD2776185.1 DNA-binding protein [Iningainema tapete BLCC-T55]